MPIEAIDRADIKNDEALSQVLDFLSAEIIAEQSVEVRARCIRAVLAELSFAHGGPKCFQCVTESYGGYSFGPREAVPQNIEDIITEELCDGCDYRYAHMMASNGVFSRPPFVWIDATLRNR